MASTPLGPKSTFWMKTVYRSLVWGLQTIRKDVKLYQRLATTQKLMVRKMMKLKRHPIYDNNDEKIGIEPWLDWQIRSMSRAGAEIDRLHLGMSNLVEGELIAWAGRISRFGHAGGDHHPVKYLVSWRPKFWWETQKWYNQLGWDTLRHIFPFKPRRWEDSLPLGWMLEYCNKGPLGHIF